MHPWWSGFGNEIAAPADLTPASALDLAASAAAGVLPGVVLIALRQDPEDQLAAVALDVEVERPQDLAHPISAREPIAVLFPLGGGQPRVLALREDFPDTPHQNWTPLGAPCSLCIDDRPWAEARLTYSSADLVRRIQLWLAKAAHGELHDTAQPPDPLFFRSEFSLVIPAAAIVDSPEPPELLGFVRNDNPRLILTQLAFESRPGPDATRFVVLAFRARPQTMTRLRHAPVTFFGLAEEMARCGVDLPEAVRTRIAAWAGLGADSVRRLSSRLAIVIAFPLDAGGSSGHDLRAFITLNTAGEVGEALGSVARNTSGAGAANAYVPVLFAGSTATGENLPIEPVDVHLAFDRVLAAAIAGQPESDRRRAVLVGAGALGSQIAADLAREGALSWTIIDQDFLFPHNLARHALFSADVGAPKAPALAHRVGGLLQEPAASAVCDVIGPDGLLREELDAAFAQAEIIIDASASVAVARFLSDLPRAKARRVCAFFNPAGTAVVLFEEAGDRAISLRDLEAQYHRLALTEPALEGHLGSAHEGLRYSGSCRALTNRIPATRASLLSALAAMGIAGTRENDAAQIRVWSVSENGEVRLVRRHGTSVHRITLGGWEIAYDEGLLAELAAMRAVRLPDETGGVLLGIADMSRKSIHVAHALPQPEDSRGSPAEFERGVAGLLGTVSETVEASLYQLRYVGEWHSHPSRASPWPGSIDLDQLAWLTAEIRSEGLPGLMAIAADSGAFSFVLGTDGDGPAGRGGSRAQTG